MAIRTIGGLIIRNSDFGGISINTRNGVTSRRVERCDVDYEFTSLPLDFIRGVANHQGYSARRSTNEMHPMRIVDVQSDDGGKLITYKNGNQLFYGHDTTAHGSGRFGFVIDEEAPVPEPERALDLLLPKAVRRAQADGAEIPRQGEWFFVPEEYATKERNGSLNKPGVAERPYGASPLDSHVPRDWAPVNADSDVIENFREHDDVEFTGSYDLDDVLESPQHVVAFYDTGRMHYESSLTWNQLQREILGGVWLRGTVRHDDRDHYVENLGDEWHLAVTHDYEVVTQDDVGTVRVD
jgi:hypothetical protein